MAYPHRFRFLLLLALTLICALLAGFGLFEYLVFGDNTQSLITQNFQLTVLLTTVMAALCTALLISFPVQVRAWIDEVGYFSMC